VTGEERSNEDTATILNRHRESALRPVVGLVAHGLDLDAVELDAELAAGRVVRGEGVQGRLAEARAAGRRLFAAVPTVVAEVRRLRAQVATRRPATIREQAIEAAAAAISSMVVPGRPWGDTADEDKPHYRDEAAAALAAAVPALLNDLADRIEAERMGDEIDDWNVALIKAAETVRAAAEGWGQA
jgi:hypothetical protein